MPQPSYWKNVATARNCGKALSPLLQEISTFPQHSKKTISTAAPGSDNRQQKVNRWKQEVNRWKREVSLQSKNCDLTNQNPQLTEKCVRLKRICVCAADICLCIFLFITRGQQLLSYTVKTLQLQHISLIHSGHRKNLSSSSLIGWFSATHWMTANDVWFFGGLFCLFWTISF